MTPPEYVPLVMKNFLVLFLEFSISILHLHQMCNEQLTIFFKLNAHVFELNHLGNVWCLREFLFISFRKIINKSTAAMYIM